jgi:hypothetical protein
MANPNPPVNADKPTAADKPIPHALDAVFSAPVFRQVDKQAYPNETKTRTTRVIAMAFLPFKAAGKYGVEAKITAIQEGNRKPYAELTFINGSRGTMPSVVAGDGASLKDYTRRLTVEFSQWWATVGASAAESNNAGSVELAGLDSL